MYDDVKEEFIYTEDTTLMLEHSLLSLSKWEAKWKKPFLTKTPRTIDETIDYIRCMVLNDHFDSNVLKGLTNDIVNAVVEYIHDPMSATTITKTNNKGGSGEIVTSELIYYWMTGFQIPFECEKWHLNRLIKLIEVCNVKNQPSKKMSKKETMSRNRALNAARRKQLNTNG